MPWRRIVPRGRRYPRSGSRLCRLPSLARRSMVPGAAGCRSRGRSSIDRRFPMYSRLSTSLVAELTGSVALSSPLVGIALAHGLVVLGFAYAYGHISGAHINPAVTVGVWAAGKIDAVRAGAYVAVQLAGGILGALALRWVLGGTATGLGATRLAQNLDLHGTPYTVTPAVGLFVEALITFFLANAVMNAGISGKATIPGGQEEGDESFDEEA